MAAVTMLARLALAAAFGIAGIAKIADRAGARASLSDFGLPDRLAGSASVLLPTVEVLVAVLLLTTRGLRAGALTAAVLLAAFTIAVIAALVRGQRPDCRCFGQLQSSPIGWKTIARNGILGACAVPLLLERAPAPSIGAAPLLAVLNGLQLFLLFEVLRRYGKLRLRLDAVEPGSGAPIGSPAPALDAIKSESTVPATSPMLLLFTEAECGPCRALWPDIPQWERAIAGALSVVVVASGARDVTAALAHEHGVRHVIVQREREIAEQYHVTATPSAVLVDADGRIASRVAIGRDEITTLLRP